MNNQNKKLSVLVEEVKNVMRENEYAEATIEIYGKIWRLLMVYAVKKTSNTILKNLAGSFFRKNSVLLIVFLQHTAKQIIPVA